MLCLLGYGLPSTLTPERIGEVLKFARSQKRQLGRALDAAAPEAWKGTGADDDLYERIHRLMRSDAGRKVYNDARRVFEGGKGKRSKTARADLFANLMASVVDEYFDGEIEQILAFLSDSDMTLSSANSIARVAEFLWALCLGTNGQGNMLLQAIDAHPELAPFLDEVVAGLVSVNGPGEEDEWMVTPEKEGEAARLVEDMRKAVAILDADRLAPAPFDEIRDALERLIEIGAAREDAAGELLSQLDKWKEDRANDIADRTKLNDILDRVGAGVDAFGKGGLEDVLARCDKTLEIERDFDTRREELAAANAGCDYAEVQRLAGILASLAKKRDAAWAAIEEIVAAAPAQATNGEEPARPKRRFR